MGCTTWIVHWSNSPKTVTTIVANSHLSEALKIWVGISTPVTIMVVKAISITLPNLYLCVCYRSTGCIEQAAEDVSYLTGGRDASAFNINQIIVTVQWDMFWVKGARRLIWGRC